MLAAQLGYFNIVYLFITNHANVNLTDEEGNGKNIFLYSTILIELVYNLFTC